MDGYPNDVPAAPPTNWDEAVEADLTVDHEQYAGEVIPDPWTDETQTDWPNAAPINPEEV